MAKSLMCHFCYEFYLVWSIYEWFFMLLLTFNLWFFHIRIPEVELPSVDMFVTTADPVLEPPIITVNTVLSLLAVDYPSHKLACYVSDDGCSPLTYYSLVEVSKFAKTWVPFCNKCTMFKWELLLDTFQVMIPQRPVAVILQVTFNKSGNGWR